MGGVARLHIIACGSFAREVPSRNLRSLSFVSWENVYNRDSEACECLLILMAWVDGATVRTMMD